MRRSAAATNFRKRGAVVGRPGGAAAGADGEHELVLVEGEWRVEHRQQLLADDFGVLQQLGARHQRHELIAAEAGDYVGGTHRALQPGADLGQERVAHGMAVRVVDGLEPSRSRNTTAASATSRASSSSWAQLANPVSGSLGALRRHLRHGVPFGTTPATLRTPPLRAARTSRSRQVNTGVYHPACSR
jgi:hypothetical protein